MNNHESWLVGFNKDWFPRWKWELVGPWHGLVENVIPRKKMEVDGDIPHGAHLGNASSPSQIIDWLVVWNIIFHILGINIPTDFHIFQRGWNHQLDTVQNTLQRLPESVDSRAYGEFNQQTFINEIGEFLKSWPQVSNHGLTYTKSWSSMIPPHFRKH